MDGGGNGIHYRVITSTFFFKRNALLSFVRPVGLLNCAQNSPRRCPSKTSKIPISLCLISGRCMCGRSSRVEWQPTFYTISFVGWQSRNRSQAV